MKIMNGFEATKQVILKKKIKNLINFSNYVNTFIIGHSSDDDSFVIDEFLKCGADIFELKPTNFKRMKIILEQNIDSKNILNNSF
jgi:response regulator of citrate/malate metabolism